MGKLWGSWFLLVLSFFFLRCSGPKIIAFTGNNPDFGSYYTYRVKHPSKAEDQDEEERLFRARIEEAIDGHMKFRKYEKTPVSDIVVTYNLILDNKVDYRETRMNPYDYRYSYYNTYGYYPMLDRSEYTEGTLLVELRENLDNSLIWQASLDLKYNQRSSQKKKKDPVEEAFDTIFSEYQYIAGQSKPQSSPEE